MDARHSCSAMPKGLSIADSGEGWRIRFPGGREWRRGIAYCPFCGLHLNMRSAFAGGTPKNARAVRCVETGAVYASAAEAERRTGVGQSGIREALRDASKRAGGLSWVYADGKPAPSGPRKRRKAAAGGRGMRVRCVETGEVFDSQWLAGEAFGCTQATISYAIRNGTRANGHRFEEA